MVILSPSSGDLLASDELSDATLSPSTEPSSRGSDTASSFLAKREKYKMPQKLESSVKLRQSEVFFPPAYQALSLVLS